MNRNFSTLIVGLCLVFLAGRAQASIIHLSKAESKYFTVIDDSSSDNTFSPSWRFWLQVHRTIEDSPKLMRKFSKHPLDLSSHEWSFKSLKEKLHEFNLKPDQIEDQPTYVYTLHIASYKKQSSVISFINHFWLAKHLEQRHVYKNTPKRLRLFVYGEFSFKNDPLYSEQVVVRKQKFTRLSYGVYESKADANADKRILERQLGLTIQILRKSPTKELIRNVWLKPVAGKWFKWEVNP